MAESNRWEDRLGSLVSAQAIHNHTNERDFEVIK